MIRFICWMLAVCLTIGFGPKLVTVHMAKSAIRAHEHDQMSYAKFTRKLLTAKPKAIPQGRDDSD